MAISKARRFNMGRAPGSPRHTGQTLVLGSAPNPVGQPQKILVRVLSCTCTSRPITGSYFAISSGEAIAETPEAMSNYKIGPAVCDHHCYRTRRLERTSALASARWTLKFPAFEVMLWFAIAMRLMEQFTAFRTVLPWGALIANPTNEQPITKMPSSNLVI